jgi:hypothetical protein
MEIRVMDMSLALKDLIGPGIAVIALAIGLLQYRSTSHTEFIKPLREMQLRLYQEASSAAAQIVSLQPQSPEWTKAKQNFLTLYYGPMAILEEFDHAAGGGDEHLSVEEAMILFKSCMDDEQQCKELGTNPTDLSLALAHTCREALGREWGYDLKQLSGDYQKLAIEYRNKLRSKLNASKIAK